MDQAYDGARTGKPNPAIRLRPAVPGDSEFLYRVFSGTREREMAIVPWDAAQKEVFLRSQFHAQRVHYERHFPSAAHDIILRGDQPAGRLYIDRTDEAIHIVDIALVSEHRGAGIGTTLVNDLLREARESRKPVLIHVEKQNPALRLYERLGFRMQSDAGIYFLMEWSVPVHLTGGICA